MKIKLQSIALCTGLFLFRLALRGEESGVPASVADYSGSVVSFSEEFMYGVGFGVLLTTILASILLAVVFRGRNRQETVWEEQENRLQDATELTRTAARLREQMELWNAVVEALPIGLFVKDPNNDFRYTHCNSAFKKLLGKTGEKIIGHTDFELKKESDAAECRRTDMEAMEQPGSLEFRQIMSDGQGKPIHLRLLKKSFVSEKGRHLLLGAAGDVTEMATIMEYQEVMNFSLNTLFREENIELAIKNVLERIGRYTKATRVFIMKYDVAHDRKNVFAEYAQEGKELMFPPKEISVTSRWTRGSKNSAATNTFSCPIWRRRRPARNWPDSTLFSRVPERAPSTEAACWWMMSSGAISLSSMRISAIR